MHKLSDEEKKKGSVWAIENKNRETRTYTNITYKDKNGDGYIDESELYFTFKSTQSARTGEKFVIKNIDENQDGIIDKCINYIIRKDGTTFVYNSDKEKGNSIAENANRLQADN